VRVLLSFEDLEPLLEGRRAARFATELMPEYPTRVPAGMLPPEWVAAVRT
jgi:hypothetical protein